MNIVTISRQVGSYGDVIAAVVARRMGLELITRDKIHEVAQSCDPEYSDACSVYETEHGPGFFERIFFDRPTYTSLFEALTYEQAAKGNVVIMGRGAQIILRDVPGVFRVRIVAPFDRRVGRIMERYAFSNKQAQDFVKKYDHERDTLMRSIFLSDPDSWSLYDLIVNTANYSSGAASDLVVHAAENIEKAPDSASLIEELRGRALAKRIETLLRKKLTSVVTRNVEVNAGPGRVIKLSGRIRDKRDKDRIEKIAADYPGVQRVENEIKVTELSFGF